MDVSVSMKNRVTIKEKRVTIKYYFTTKNLVIEGKKMFYSRNMQINLERITLKSNFEA